MPNLNFEAAKQLRCLEARIAQLKQEYEENQFIETITRRAGRKRLADRYRQRSRELMSRLSYLISLLGKAKHRESIQPCC